MKLKEIPVSIYNSAKLLAISVKRMNTAQKEEIPVIVSLTNGHLSYLTNGDKFCYEKLAHFARYFEEEYEDLLN